MTNKLSLEEQISELQDVIASLDAHYESVIDDICEIIFEGEDTNVGRKVTINRIKQYIGYDRWLEESD